MLSQPERCLASAIARAMALAALLVSISDAAAGASVTHGEMAVANVTRFEAGDFFTVYGTDCGPTRCMEASHGTALGARPVGSGLGAAAMSPSACLCQCRPELPAFREDQNLCVQEIEECENAVFGRGAVGAGAARIPSVYLPLKGQIIHPSKEIIFTEVENSVCAVTNAQYLSPSGWVTLREFDNDVPFGLYRDEGNTFLQWRGSTVTRARLEGRLVLAHVLCSAPPAHLATPCAPFRVDGIAHPTMIDVPSIVFGEAVSAESGGAGGGGGSGGGLSVLESLAVGVCVLLLVFLYAAGIVFYVHYKKRTRRKEKDAENSNTLSTAGSTLERLNMDNVTLKTNPLLKMDAFATDYLQDTLSDVSERTEENLEVPDKPLKKPHIIAAMVHSTRKKSLRKLREHMSSPSSSESGRQRRAAAGAASTCAGGAGGGGGGAGARPRRALSPDALERAPHSHVAIVDCRGDMEPESCEERPASTAVRRKLYFNPVFFEPEHLKNPPPAAIEFLVKIREVMSIAKEKMTSKKFLPILTDIPEEESYHTIDLGWDIPCGRRGRRFSAISLKRENSRRTHRCTGCPGCDTSSLQDLRQTAFTRSNSCKSCVSEDFKQKIVRKWLDEVPPPLQPSRPIKSIAMVSGTPRTIEPKKPISETKAEEPKTTQKIDKKDIVVIKSEVSPPHSTRRVRKKLPPPPPPPVPPPPPPEDVDIPKEVKQKMEAVIKELSECRRVEPIAIEDVRTESTKPIEPRLVIPVLAADVYYDDSGALPERRRSEVRCEYEMDSLERGAARKRRFSLAGGSVGKRRISHHDGAVSMDELEPPRIFQDARLRLSQSCKDVRKAVESFNSFTQLGQEEECHSMPVSEVFINPVPTEPMYGNVPRPGALTIQVRGSPVRERRTVNDDFDPDTLDRKPRLRASEKSFDDKKRVDKILLKSAGSFKHKLTDNILSDDPIVPTDSTFTRKIGSLRQIYEAKTKAQATEDLPYTFFDHGDSAFKLAFEKCEFPPFTRSTKVPDLVRQAECARDPKPPVPPKQNSRRGADGSPKYANVRVSPTGEGRRARGSPDEKERLSYSRAELLHSRRSGRKSARFRNRRADIKKLYKTEDSGYLSTDSNESKRRARFMMHIRARAAVAEYHQHHQQASSSPSPLSPHSPPSPPLGSDTDELESLCDGRSESGAESVETDSVFFGNFDPEPERLYSEIGLNSFAAKALARDALDQIDSGFVGETSILVSGDSDSEHRSVISIVTGRDGRASSASVRSVALHDEPYAHSVEC